MILTTIKRFLCVFAAAIVYSASGGAYAADDTRYKVADGIAIYLGVVPAEIILGHPKEHPETQMHGGPSGTGDLYHVVVALFEQSTGERIVDARVTARVIPLGRAGTGKTLERMVVAGAATYGNYYAMPDPGPYQIEVQIQQRDVSRESQATFDYRKPDE